MDFSDILDKYRSEAYSERDKGTKFEELMVRYFMTEPTYSSLLESVVIWNNFFAKGDFGGRDTGIDLVAKTKTGEYWAIQCKCYAEDNRVGKEDIDTFLSTSGRMFHDHSGNEVAFSQRFVVATTDNWGFNAISVTENQTIPVNIVSLSMLNDSVVRWEELEDGAHGKSARKEKYSLRPHQQEALGKALKYYRTNDRGKMIMACGTGKTFTSLRLAEALTKEVTTEGGGKRCILFLAPSIALVGQTLREWMANAESGITPICVCSDISVSKKKEQDDIGERVEDLGAPATTDAGRIAFQYLAASDSVVIFSTYQSIDAVISAQKHGLPDFDLIICDEAHRTTGAKYANKDEGDFTKVHSNDNIRAKKRLYMTATPRIYGEVGKKAAEKASAVLFSMDDEAIYGKEFYKITFGEAVDKGLLTDYKVIILTNPEGRLPTVLKTPSEDENGELGIDIRCKIWGCLSALAKNMSHDETLVNADPNPMQSAVIFSRTIAMSKDITAVFKAMAKSPLSPIRLDVEHVDGSMPALNREEKLNWLKKGNGSECHALSNVRCLSEGVDVPALDSIIFMGSKSSIIDVVQSVGRVMRKAEGKKYGYIIIPVYVPEGGDANEELDNNDQYKIVWDVLRALRSHDERIEAEINTILLTKEKKGKRIRIVTPGGSDDGPLPPPVQTQLDEFANVMIGKFVNKVGEKEYIENWAKDVAKIMPDLLDRLTKICKHEEHGYKQYEPSFEKYLKGLRSCVNDNVGDSSAIDMLAQQIITKPIFEELFAKDGFVMQNPISQTIDEMLEKIDSKHGLKDLEESLGEFHDNVERTLGLIDSAEGKQKVVTSLYEKFFKNAFPKDQAIDGVVYTPIEIVDFILHSVADALKEEFGMDLNDPNVNILDPFTGTGTFIARLLESGIITKENLERKYRNELFANEITLLAYYIATVNIETTFAKVTGNEVYVPFENILLTDTFNIEKICKSKTVQSDLDEGETFVVNKKRIRKEHDTPITVIVGNPPYGANQKSANDDAKKRRYLDGVDNRILETYLDDSLFTDKKGNVNSVYDNYIRAFRWATDRIGNNNGIIAFVTPSGWLTGAAFDGFRKHIESEFSRIYIFNLRGDQNGSNWRLEGEKIFGEGSKVGISIMLLVSKKDFQGKAEISYMKTGDGMKRIAKLDMLKSSYSFSKLLRNRLLENIMPKPNGDWIIQRNEAYQSLIPIAGDTHKKFEKHNENTIFVGYTNGYKTNRDVWSYNFSENKVKNNMKNMVEEYNKQVLEGKQIFDSSKISWDSTLTNEFNRGKKAVYHPDKISPAAYRPFSKRWFYSDNMMINTSSESIMFPNPNVKNRLICVASIGDKNEFSCLITEIMTDLHLTGTSQCFPLYWYIDNTKGSKLGDFLDVGNSPSIARRDGISDYALTTAKSKYSPYVTKEDIFYYVYGYLHSPDYRKSFAEDLKLSLPRIDFVSEKRDFDAFAKAGRVLAKLHLDYENQEPLKTILVNGKLDCKEILKMNYIYRVKKMKVLPEERKVIYNEQITIENIPEEAFEYVVNGRTAIGWIANQYQYSVDKDSGIVNDPNEYAGGEYIFKLLLSVITVSVETMKIVKNLPKLNFGEQPEKKQ